MHFLSSTVLALAFLVATAPLAAATCDHGKPTNGEKHVKSIANKDGATGATYHTGPGYNYKKKEPKGEFILSPPGITSSSTVRLLCKKGQWVKVRPIRYEGEPIKPTPNRDDGMDDEIGWVHMKYLEDEKSELEKKGVWWTPDVPHLTEGMTDKDIKIAIRGALQLVKNEPACEKVSNISFYPKKNPNEPFSASCVDANGDTSSRRFSAEQVQRNTGIDADEPYAKAASIERCKGATKERVKHASSIDWATLSISTEIYKQKIRLVHLPFSAKNAIGNRINYQANCRVRPNGAIGSMNIVRR